MASTRSAVKEPRTDASHQQVQQQETEVDRALLAKFRQYRRSSSPQLREELVCHYLPLARRIARRYVRVGVPLDDLAQIGTIGLMNAVGSFDPGRGVPPAGRPRPRRRSNNASRSAYRCRCSTRYDAHIIVPLDALVRHRVCGSVEVSTKRGTCAEHHASLRRIP